MKLYSYTKYRSLHFDKTMYSKLKLELQQEVNKMVSVTSLVTVYVLISYMFRDLSVRPHRTSQAVKNITYHQLFRFKTNLFNALTTLELVNTMSTICHICPLWILIGQCVLVVTADSIHTGNPDSISGPCNQTE